MAKVLFVNDIRLMRAGNLTLPGELYRNVDAVIPGKERLNKLYLLYNYLNGRETTFPALISVSGPYYR